MAVTKSPAANFERWSALARHDPAAFEHERARVIAESLRHVSGERRLRLQRLQWRIDRLRDRAPTPLAAAVRIYGMMWDSVIDLDGALNQRRVPGPGRTARILPFPVRRPPGR